MPRRSIQYKNNIVKWLGNELNTQNVTNSFRYYEKFQFGKIIAEVGDFVLVSNADAADPDSEEGCDAARIISLYEDSTNNSDPFRATVQWYSRPADLPAWCFNNIEPINFMDKEVIEDHRPFDTDVSIETFFKKCNIKVTFTKDDRLEDDALYHYICRYRLMNLSRRKVQIEPVLEQERYAIQLLSTPKKNLYSPRNSKTPTSLVKRMARVSLTEQKNWSVSKNDGTKLLLKRAILADITEKESPKKATSRTSPKYTPKCTVTPISSRKLNAQAIEELLETELIVNSDDELPTLVIKQPRLDTPKRKQSASNSLSETPKKVLLFEDNDKETYITRSGRKTKNVNCLDPQVSPIKRTPRKVVLKYKNEENDDDFKPTPATPKTSRTPRTPRITSSDRTPNRKVTRRILTSQLTPTLHSRANPIDNIDEILEVNNSLPGREHQLEEILSYVRTKLLDGVSGCMYISGVPGTGKTATVCSALKILKEEVDLPDFQLVEVNGMRIAEPRQAYVQIYKQLTGKTVVWEQACSLLEKRFTNPGPRRIPTVLLVDELDALCTRRQDVLYNIMEWASHASALLTVVAVANTMDLPERVMVTRVTSRLGLTRLTFPPYTHTQLQVIVATRLNTADVTPDAVQLIARKVAAVSGDARRALALCGRALELAAAEGAHGTKSAGLGHVQRALEEASSGVVVRAIRACAPAQLLMLRAIAAEVERTGTDETTLSRALDTASAIMALEGRAYRCAPHIRAPTPSQALALCARLAATRLVLLDKTPTGTKLLLNASVDDIHYATKTIHA